MSPKGAESPSIVWFRRDLRLADQPALAEAVRRGGPILPVFIVTPDDEEGWARDASRRWWLPLALEALDRELAARGARLLVRRGEALSTLRELVRELGAGAVFWNRRYEPGIVARDGELKAALRGDGVEVRSFGAGLLVEPWEVATRTGDPYRVFTPFWRTALAGLRDVKPLPAPEGLRAVREVGGSSFPPVERTVRRMLRYDAPPEARLGECWTPGIPGAQARLEVFLRSGLTEYGALRDRPDRAGTSRLSPHLHFGEIGPAEVWRRVRTALEAGGEGKDHPFLTELGWREFAHHLLYHAPESVRRPLRPEFERFPWRNDPEQLSAWKEGRTGYPFVDAGMRELLATGWMHNRVRMVVASFLVKHLLLPWWEGAQWFEDRLVDADLANNTLGWQWVAGSGADAAPYFRIFHPVRQGERHDPEGAYVRQWVPELSRIRGTGIHAPWELPEQVLAEAGVRLGRDYPEPLVEHRAARERALAAWSAVREGTAGRG